MTDDHGKTATTTQDVTVTVNVAPTAAQTSSCTALDCTFDGTGSTDPDGTIASYSWNFGDNTSGTGATPKHSYVVGGTYSVVLTVTDNGGKTNSVTRSVTVTSPNAAPKAAFTSDTSGLKVSVDGSTSTDTDGTVSSYAWDFGDGTSGTGKTTSHTYSSGGTYSVVLTVTDDGGATDSVTHAVTVSKTNAAPKAAFTSDTSGLKVSVDGSTSTDTDGTVSSYAWDFGDGTSGTGKTTSHTYSSGGTYSVVLTVTDDGGATDSVTHAVTVSKTNAAPKAAFTSDTSGLKVSVDGSTSTDTDGTVSSYAWDFGDGTSGTGKTTSHTYSSGGTYSVVLTVTDDGGATDSVTHSVTATAPSPTLANDSFSRSLSSGWGSADTGGAWTIAGGSSNVATNGSTGVMKLAATSTLPMSTLDTVSASDVIVTTDLSVDKVPNGTGASTQVLARRSGKNYYWLKVRYMADGSVNLAEGRTVNGVETVIKEVKASGLTYAAGTTLRLKFSVTGTSTAALAGKVWLSGSPEPAANQISVTDSTADLAVAGSVGLRSYTSGTTTNVPVTVSVDNFSAVRP